MPSTTGQAQDHQTQRMYARVAGFLLLAVIVIAVVSGLILSRIASGDTFAQRVQQIAASQYLYRAGLSATLIVSLGSTLLAFALYATLKPVNSLLAQLAMIFSLADSFVALIVRMCSFVNVHLYLSQPAGGPQPFAVQSLADLMGAIADTTENIGGICFGIGTFLFFYLFFQSGYIPRVIAALGVCASAIWTVVYFANLIFPEQHKLFMKIGFPPLALAEISTGFYLLLFAVRTEGSNHLTQQA